MTYISADTSVNTDCGVTAGSQGTIVSGLGQIGAAADLKKQWAPIIAASLGSGTNASNIVWANGTVYDSTNPSKTSMTFRRLRPYCLNVLEGQRQHHRRSTP